MTARAYIRGWPVEFARGRWIYTDTREPATVERACPRCHRMPTAEGYDACLGAIPGAVAACCGHGVKPAYVVRRAGLSPAVISPNFFPKPMPGAALLSRPVVAVTVDLTPLTGIALAELGGRRYVLLEPICRFFGLPLAPQVRRARRQPGMTVVLIGDARSPAIPAIELSWFLRTLRPRREDARARLERYRDEIVTEANADKPRAGLHRRVHQAPVRRSRFTAGDVAEMRRRRAAGESYGGIAKRYGCKKGTICDLLTGRRQPS